MSWTTIIFFYGLACIGGTAGFCYLLYRNQQEYRRKKLEVMRGFMDEAWQMVQAGQLTMDDMAEIGPELMRGVEDKDASILDMRHYFYQRVRQP